MRIEKSLKRYDSLKGAGDNQLLSLLQLHPIQQIS